MLKKHNKLVLILVLATFMFSIVGTAGAATFSDVTGNSAAADIYKLNSLGIIDGYPDGTFGPEKTVTRAEFAKIAVITAGLKDVASGMANVPSTFSDVDANEWYNGWVNVAAAQGFVKGYPDGTFKPQAQVTQAEAITVLLRILGYNDNLAGEWPSDYIAKAANLGVLDDVTFVANKAATRGEVAIITSAVLDENIVVYKASDNIFEEKSPVKTLMEDKFKDSQKIEKALITGVDLSDGKVTLTVNADKAYEVNENCVVANGASWYQVKDRFVDLVINDDEEIISIVPKDYKVINMDAEDVTVKTAVNELPAKINLDGKDYSCTANVFLAMDKTYKTAFTTAAAVNASVDSYEFVLNSDGDIALIKAIAWKAQKDDYEGIAKVGIVDSVTAKTARIKFVNAGSIDLDEEDAENYYIVKNGAPAELADVKAGDMVWDFTSGYNVEHYLIVSDATVSGEAQSIETDGVLTKVTIDGKTYKVPTDGAILYSDDEGDSFTLKEGDYAIDAIEEVLDENVTAWLTPAGKIAAISSGVTSSTKIYGVINDDKNQSLVNGKLVHAIEVLKADGTMATYAFDADSTIGETNIEDNWTTAQGAGVCNDSFVEITLNSDGYVDEIKVNDGIKKVTTVNGKSLTGDKDMNVVTIDGSSYDAKDLVVFNLQRDDNDVQIIDTADFMDKIDGATNLTLDAKAVVMSDNGKVSYLVVNDETLLASGDNLAMIAGKGRNSDGDYVTILLADGTTQKYTVKSGSAAMDKNSIYTYELVSGKINNTEFKDWDSTISGVYEVTDINNNIIKLGNTNFFVDGDTLYYDSTDSDPVAIELGDIAVGDFVKIYREKDTGALDAVQVVNESAK